MDTHTCCHCKIEKKAGEFSKDKYKKSGLKSRCKECYKLFLTDPQVNYFKSRYQNDESFRTKCKQSQKNSKEKIQSFINDLKLAGCSRCGIKSDYFCIFEFHHRDPSIKEFNISKGQSLERIKEEVKKCDILCSNCHKIVHAIKKAEVTK